LSGGGTDAHAEGARPATRAGGGGGAARGAEAELTGEEGECGDVPWSSTVEVVVLSLSLSVVPPSLAPPMCSTSSPDV
jgi:hypothetical protein